MLPILTGFFILSREIITMISGTKYVSVIGLIPFLILFPLFDVGNRIYNKILLLENKTKTLAGIYISGMILNIILNLVLVPRYSIYGAAIATTISYAVLFALFYHKVHKNIKIDHSFVKSSRIILSTVIMAAAIFFIHPQNAITKIMTICLGAVVYFSSLFFTKAYVKEELTLVKSFIPLKQKP